LDFANIAITSPRIGGFGSNFVYRYKIALQIGIRDQKCHIKKGGRYFGFMFPKHWCTYQVLWWIRTECFLLGSFSATRITVGVITINSTETTATVYVLHTLVYID